MKLILVKQLNNTFKVAYDSDFEKLKYIKAGDKVMCEIRKPRNIGFHNKFFALIELVFQNQEVYKNKDDLRKDLIVEAGFYEQRVDFHGVVHHKPKSISFASMDEDEFQDLYNKVLDVIVQIFAWDKDDILDNIEQYF